jgi:hypothetical protein
MYKILIEHGVVASLWYVDVAAKWRRCTSDTCETVWDAIKNLREKWIRSVAKVDMKVKCGDFGKEATIIQVLTDMVVTSRGSGQVQAWKFSEISWIEGMDEVFPRH